MRRLQSGFKNAIAFLILAPPIGVVIYSLWGWVLAGGDGPTTLMGVLWLLPLGYLIGGLYAAATGFLIGLVAEPSPPLPYFAAAVVLGALVAGAVALIDAREPSSTDGVGALVAIGAAASLGAAVARWLIHRRRRALPIPA